MRNRPATEAYYPSLENKAEVEKAEAQLHKAANRVPQNEEEIQAKFRDLINAMADSGMSLSELPTPAVSTESEAMGDFLDSKHIADTLDTSELDPLRPVGVKADAEKLKKKSIQESPAISRGDNVALRAQVGIKYCKHLIDKGIRTGTPSDADAVTIAKFLHSLVVMTPGAIADPGLNPRYAMPEVLTFMVERARDLAKAELAQHLCDEKLKPAEDLQARQNALVALDLNNLPQAATVGDIHRQLKTYNPVPGRPNVETILTQLGIPQTAHDSILSELHSPQGQHFLSMYLSGLKPTTDMGAQKRALSDLGLSEDHKQVTLTQVQDALIKLSPDDKRIPPILTGLGIPLAAQSPLLKIVDSQRKLEADVLKANTNIEAINKKRTGKDSKEHEAAKKGLAELHSLKTWDRLVKDFSAEDKQAGISSVAALEAARTVLDPKTDLSKPEDVFKDKISKPIIDASPKDDKSAPRLGQAAESGAQRAIAITQKSLEERKDAKSAASMAIKVLRVADPILRMKPEDFKGRQFHGGYGGFEKPVEDGKNPVSTGEALEIAEFAKDQPEIKSLIAKGKVWEAQKRVTQATAIGAALKEIEEIQNNPCIYRIVGECIDKGVPDEKTLNDLIAEFPGVTKDSAKIHTAVRTAQSITEGVAASNQAIAATKSEIEKAGTDSGLPAGVAKAIANKLQSRLENKQNIDNPVIHGLIEQETNRASRVINNVTKNINNLFKDAKGKGLPKKIIEAVIKQYLATGDLDDNTVETIIKPFFEDQKETVPPENVINSISNAVKSGLKAQRLDQLYRDKSVTLTDPQITTFTEAVTNIYGNIPAKVAYDAALATAKAAGVPEEKAKEVAKAAQDAIVAGKTPEEAAKAATQLLDPEHEAARVPLTAVLSREPGLPYGQALTNPQPNMSQRVNRQAIEKAYAQSHQRAVTATSTAIGAAVDEFLAKEDKVSAPITDAVVKASITDKFASAPIRAAIDAAEKSVNKHADELYYRFTDVYLGLPNCHQLLWG